MEVTSNPGKLIHSENLLSDTKIANNIKSVFDESTFMELNPLYATEKSGIVCGCGKICSKNVFAFMQNINSNSGAVSKSHIEKILALYDLAAKVGNPVIGFFDSCGADLEEGNEVFKIFSKLIGKVSRLSGIIPQISVILGPCFGSSAVFASCFDIMLMSEDANIGLDIGGGNSDIESAKSTGTVHIIEKKEKLFEKLKSIICLIPENNVSFIPRTKYFQNCSDSQVQSCRQMVLNIFDESSFIEFQKDFGKHFSVGLASIFGYTVGEIASNSDLSDFIDANSCAKAARFIRFCDSYSIPIITFVDAAKFLSLRETAKISSAYADATSPKITVIIGKAYGSVYTSLCSKGVSDITLGWEGSHISFLPPETAVEILWSDKLKGDGLNPKKHKENVIKEYLEREASALKAANDGLIDEIIFPKDSRKKIYEYLEILINKRERKLPKKHSNIQI